MAKKIKTEAEIERIVGRGREWGKELGNYPEDLKSIYRRYEKRKKLIAQMERQRLQESKRWKKAHNKQKAQLTKEMMKIFELCQRK